MDSVVCIMVRGSVDVLGDGATGLLDVVVWIHRELVGDYHSLARD